MTRVSDRPRIAIACQGGGSHTAFTAGALSAILRRIDDLPGEICAFSGTSGGAVCATLAWYGLLLDGQEYKGASKGQRSIELLQAFWRDNSAQQPWEQLLNGWLVGHLRLADGGGLPSFASSPYSADTEWLQRSLQWAAPRREFVDFRALLERHIDFTRTGDAAAQRLLLGAVEVLSGAFKTFDSARGEISVDAVLASGALPDLFKAVAIGEGRYWDGLLSQNPPLTSLLDTAVDDKPDEIWLLRINPQTRASEPRSAEEIADRRNELAGNLSLNQELLGIQRINRWLGDGRLCDATKKTIRLREISMAEEEALDLDHASKMDRTAEHIQRLIDHGEARAEQLLATLSTVPTPAV